MNFDSNSKIVMITSAGCNALDYLLDEPREIYAVDMNFRQNAVLDLKKALFKSKDHDTLWSIFGKGKNNSFETILEDLKDELNPSSFAYWRRNKHMFSGKGLRKSFYYYSSSGFLAWCVINFMQLSPSRRKLLDQFMRTESLEEQRQLYPEVEQHFIGRFVRFLLKREMTMYLLGVPKSQIALFNELYEDGIEGYIKMCLRKVFLHLPISENYFYSLYYYGHYEEDRRPNYLKPEYFSHFKEHVDRIETYTGTIEQFLVENPGAYTHFILLDHQDWLAQNNRAALENEWKQILKNSAPSAKYLLRSAALEVDFFPDFVLDRVHFHEEEMKASHAQDRVGTYGSVYLAELK
jgi:S-adenosylmethionine-diacylglycerol 3-amino-3-carboxypropyl transferase